MVHWLKASMNGALLLSATLATRCGALSTGSPPTRVHGTAYVHSNLFRSRPEYSSPIQIEQLDKSKISRHRFSFTPMNLKAESESNAGPEENTSKRQLLREMLAEMLGTFLIVQLGTGAVMSAVFTGSLSGIFQIGGVFSIAVMLAICATASVSGAHLNPAMSIAFAAVRTFQWSKVLPYISAQMAGALLGSYANLIMYASSIRAFEAAGGINRASAAALASAKAFGEYFADPISTPIALFAEALGTGILAFIIFALTNPKNDTMKEGFVPPLIGISVGALICVIAPLTQAGFNPARDFAPRIVAYLAGYRAIAFKSWWVYVFAPIFGAVGGAALADKVLYADD